MVSVEGAVHSMVVVLVGLELVVMVLIGLLWYWGGIGRCGGTGQGGGIGGCDCGGEMLVGWCNCGWCW